VDNPFSWSYLTATNAETPTFGPFSILYLVIFGFVFIASVVVVRVAPKRFEDHKLKRDTVMKGATLLMWEAGIGLVLFLPRALEISFFTLERRIWLYLAFLVLVGTLGYFAYYLKVVYPPLLAEFERRRERRKYVAPAQAGQARARRSGSKSKGQRARG